MLSDKWTEIEFALQMLGISEEEAKGIWAILAAICHLGCAGVAVGKCIIQLRLEPTDPLEMLLIVKHNYLCQLRFTSECFVHLLEVKAIWIWVGSSLCVRSVDQLLR